MLLPVGGRLRVVWAAFEAGQVAKLPLCDGTVLLNAHTPALGPGSFLRYMLMRMQRCLARLCYISMWATLHQPLPQVRSV